MALQSPGVQVTVIDESFYTPAEPGTTSLIVVATAQDKRNGAGTGTAVGTLKANAGKAYRMTSQRDLTEFFGVPFFEKSASNNPVHGGERNEYGLLAAYSLLGVSNSAFIVRADINLDELEPQTDAPGSNPSNGKWWINTQATSFGIQEWNGSTVADGGQRFAGKNPIVLTDADSTKITGGVPNGSVGSIGDYAIVFQTVGTSPSFSADKELAKLYFKSPGNGTAADGGPNWPGGGTGVNAGDWVLVGSREWAASWPVFVGTVVDAVDIVAGSFELNGVTINIGTPGDTDTIEGIAADINQKTITGVTARAVGGRLYLYSNAANDFGGIVGSPGDSSRSNAIVINNEVGAGVLDALGGLANNKTYHGLKLAQSPHTQVPFFKRGDPNDEGNGSMEFGRPSGSVWIKTTEPGAGARWRVSRWNSGVNTWIAYDAPLYASTHEALYYLDRAGGGTNISADALFVQTNAQEHTLYDTDPPTAQFRVWRRAAAGATSITSNKITAGTFVAGTNTFVISESLKNSTTLAGSRTVTCSAATGNALTGAVGDADKIAAAINAAGFSNIEASVITESATTKRLVITHKLGGDFRITDGSNSPIGSAFSVYNIDSGAGTAGFYNLTQAGTGGTSALIPGATDDYLASNWRPFAADDFAASNDAPLNEPTDGQMWYNPTFAEVDVMVHNGKTWVGYRSGGPGVTTPSPYYEVASGRTGYAPIVSASNPYVSGMQTGDLWISTADLENFPTIYRYDSRLTDISDPANRWVLVDKTDQITEEGILFADARWDLDGTSMTPAAIDDLLRSNYLDPDAPDPALYPRGMLLWNLRRSGGNVKKYINNYIDTTSDNPRFDNSNDGSNAGEVWVAGQSMADYATDRWVSAAANNEDGSGCFGRKAQRRVVVQALKSVVDTSSEIRDEERRNFNVIAAPGYPELMSNLVNLNIDRGITAFVVGDTPLRLPADATSITNWATNANLVTDNGDDGIVTYDEYMAIFYPNGFTTDLSGSNAVVPASHMMLKTLALSDQVSYPWFAPAGTRRGGITNATSVGYIDSLSGEFQTVALNEGQRDTLYDNKINPIAFFNGVGHVNYGQKTRARNASALDRINVARLVVYLRSQLNKLARPYIFEPNDDITRAEIKGAVESLLLELVGLRAIYDFAVQCDENNNTPARVDRNELWVDIAIEPVKAIEFIYIPLRVKNTGEI